MPDDSSDLGTPAGGTPAGGTPTADAGAPGAVPAAPGSRPISPAPAARRSRRAAIRAATLRRLVRRWWAPSLVLVIAVAASLSVFFLERIEDVDARQDHALGDVAAAVNQLSAAEWEGIAEKSISTLLKDRVNASLMDIETGLRALNAIAPESSASWQKLSGLIDRYRASQADETALVQAGRFADAEVVDRSRVDPAFRDLDGYTRELRAASQSDAERQAFFTRVSSVAAILLSLAVVALVVRRSSPRRPKLVARG